MKTFDAGKTKMIGLPYSEITMNFLQLSLAELGTDG